jgi:hypothetical protein
MKITQLFILLMILCQQLNAQDNSEYKKITKYFSKDQITVLENIISFVDSAVIKENINIVVAYKQYFNSIEAAYLQYHDSLEVNYHYANLLLDQDIKEKFLLNLPEDVFNKIWTKQIPQSIMTRDTTLYYPENFWSFSLNVNGDYLKLLKALGRNDRYYQTISRSILTCGGLCPTVFGGIFRQVNEFDFDKFTDRLWVAIFLITIEEPTETRVTKYLSK